MPIEGNIIGLMSGTSLDGLDIANVRFGHHYKKWTFRFACTETIAYPDEWKKKLKDAHYLDSLSLLKLDVEFGRYLAGQVQQFLQKHRLNAELIGSHGHTIFHQPDNGISFQLGSGKALAKASGLTVVSDFRTDDVLYGGQGAPFAPIGDFHLFNEYQFRINLGGFSNISYEDDGVTRAFDICPVNYILNKEALKKNRDFDYNGKLAQQGAVNIKLLKELNQLRFYQNKPPKSLGREWVDTSFYPVAQKMDLSPEDKLATYVEHISTQISGVLNRFKETGKVLLTGGGAKNGFLLKKLQEKTSHRIIVPDVQLVDFKEALIFAFMAKLRIEGEINVFSSVTGASRNTSAGTIFTP